MINYEIAQQTVDQLSSFYKAMITDAYKEIETLKIDNKNLKRRVHNQRIEIKQLNNLLDKLKAQKEEVIKWKAR